ncbi:hypothetical protein BBJ28_00005029 [Nothophytophthora sp. Chile5]|nr:hypothetical protein BBJ28_00005029 [Nothophytophthora sp. Chile5]
MDLLEGGEEDLVSEALAFIDAFEGGEERHAVVSSSSDDGSPTSASSYVPNGRSRGQGHKPRRKRKTQPGYSTMMLHRKKAELRDLRDEAQELEQWLERLKRSTEEEMFVELPTPQKRHNESAEATEEKPTWMQRALLEFHKRQQAEHTNRSLRAVLENQMKVGNTLRGGMAFVTEAPLSVRHPLARVDNSSALIAQLEKRVDQLHWDADTVFPQKQLPSFGCRLQPKRDKYRGRTIEIVANAPVSCPMIDASDILWQELSKYPDKSYRYMKERGPDAMAKSFDMTLRGQRGALPVNGLQFMRKYEEADRLFVECQEGFSARPEDLEYIQKIGLDAWGLKMRAYSQWLQELVVEAAETQATATSRSVVGETRLMSFLDPEDDVEATLADALAFIDAYACDDGDAEASRSDCGDAKRPRTHQERRRIKKPKRNRKTSDDTKSTDQAVLCYSTQLQQRKKAELQALRDEAVDLEAQVKQLHQRRQRLRRPPNRRTRKENASAASATCTTLCTTSDVDMARMAALSTGGECNSPAWFKQVVVEFHRRRQAEQLNRKLKEIWARQAKVNGSLQHLLQKKSLLCVRVVATPLGCLSQSMVDRLRDFSELSVEDETMSIISQLEKSVDRLYLDSNSVFDADEPTTISCCTNVKRSSDTQGNCIEIVTTTPVSCALEYAAAVVWKDLNVKGPDPERIYRFIRGRKPDSLEKNFMVALHNKAGVLNVDGTQFMRKFEEPDRVVLIKANVLRLPNHGLRFRDRTWIIISRSKSNPAHASVARTCYQLYADGPEGFSTREDVAPIRDYVLSSLSGKTHEMSFLVPEDDAEATLADALALIDAYAGDDADADELVADCGGVACPPSRQEQRHSKQPKISRTNSSQDTLGYSTQLQQRKKAELLALRYQVMELETQLNQLLQRRQHQRASTRNPTDRITKYTHTTSEGNASDVEKLAASEGCNSPAWFKQVIVEFRRRQRAEETNRKLKDIWGREFIFEDYESGEAAAPDLAESIEDETMSIISQLEKSVDRLYLDSNSVFDADEPTTISCSTNVKRSGDTYGNCIEIITTTPVACALQDAAAVVWKDVNIKCTDPERIYRFIRGRKPDSLEKNFMVALHNKAGVFKIDGVQFMRKFEEPDRVVLIKTNVLKLPDYGLGFRERTWIIISRSKSDAAHASVARICYQLYAESLEGCSVRGDVAPIRDYVLSALSGKARHGHQEMQNLLIEEERRTSIGNLAFTCSA